MSKPEEERLHGFALNTLAFQCWCYECDDVISPPLFASLESEEGAPTISSVASTGSRRKSIKTLPFELPLGVGKISRSRTVEFYSWPIQFG